ncbi:MAG: site-2 protease family protein [Clostridia bacterium]|nr:site-2 protease family protein [Clostridia bacterium]MBQ8339993.1 site-2 protease family protein [Clostridia bacterium]
MTFLYILLAIFSFGMMIMIHELGHFLVAKACGVGIHEFSLGMGPRLVSKKGQKWHFFFSKPVRADEAVPQLTPEGMPITEYSLRLLPIGGFVSMVGEDEESNDPHALCNKKAWQRMLIMAAGAVMNLLLGLILTIVLVCITPHIPSTTVDIFREGATSCDYGLQSGDVITHVNGVRVFSGNELSYEIMYTGYKPVDLTVKRDGKILELEDVIFPTEESEGIVFGVFDFYVLPEEKTPVKVLQQSFTRAASMVKMVYDSLFDLLTGRFGLDAMSGPVGVTEGMVTAAKVGPQSFIYLVAVITINLGVFNLLPFPALDGGRLFFLLIEVIIRRPINKNIEGYIHFAGILLLFLLMAVVLCKDIIKLLI